MSTLELSQMRHDVRDLTGVGGLSVALVLYRSGVALAAQAVHLYAPGGASTATGSGTEAAQTNVQVVGAVGMDIRARDRFNHNGQAYEVVAVMPQRQIATTATARLLQ